MNMTLDQAYEAFRKGEIELPALQAIVAADKAEAVRAAASSKKPWSAELQAYHSEKFNCDVAVIQLHGPGFGWRGIQLTPEAAELLLANASDVKRALAAAKAATPEVLAMIVAKNDQDRAEAAKKGKRKAS